MSENLWTRRDIVRLGTILGLAPVLSSARDTSMMQRPIPVSDELLPVIGLGTYIVFDVESTPANIAVRKAIVDMLAAKGGSLLDSSPMYGRSEKIIGDIIAAAENRDHLFLATKVWTDGRTSGEQQMNRSAALMNTDTIDLMQVHNLRDLDTQMATIREFQQEGRIRYNGITHYRSSAFNDLERIVNLRKPDFLQINYSLGESEADQRILPLAHDLGVAVLVNRPFVTGQLFRAVGNRPLPEWALEFAASWGQFFLKYITSHPAVTCVIPATSSTKHMADNLAAGFGALPDASVRSRMKDLVESL